MFFFIIKHVLVLSEHNCKDLYLTRIETDNNDNNNYNA